MKYKVNEEGVEALRGLAVQITDALDQIKSAADALSSGADEYRDAIGPHQSSIEQILETLRVAQEQATDPANSVSEKLNETAAKYQEIIDDDPFSGLGN